MQDLLAAPTSSPIVESAALLPAESPEMRRSYRIGVSDELSVTMWGRDDLGSQLPDRGNTRRDVSIVDPDGMLHLPLVDPILGAGRTLDEIRGDLILAYQAIVPQADVIVDVVAYRSKSVRVLGEARKTGLYHISDQLRTVGHVIASAGGLSPEADGAHGILIRDGRRYHVPYRGGTRGENPLLDVLLEDADTLYFPTTQERVVYVFGEVAEQGKVPIPDRGLLLLEALGEDKGPLPASVSYDHIFLVRPQPGGAEAYELTMTQLLEGPDIAMLPGDRLVLPPSRLANWERFWRQLLPLFNSVLGFAVTGAALGL
jgi:protein involved in polysaccharide export with SLBB domain